VRYTPVAGRPRLTCGAVTLAPGALGAIEANPCRRDQPRLDGESRDVNRHDCGKSWLFGRKMPEWGERDDPTGPRLAKAIQTKHHHAWARPAGSRLPLWLLFHGLSEGDDSRPKRHTRPIGPLPGGHSALPALATVTDVLADRGYRGLTKAAACITPESRSKLLHPVQSGFEPIAPLYKVEHGVCPARALATAVALFRANADERRGMAPDRGVRVSARTSLNAKAKD